MLAAGLLVVAGAWVLLFGIPATAIDPGTEVGYEIEGDFIPGISGFPVIESHFPIQSIERIVVSVADRQSFHVDIANYRNQEGVARRAQIFLPDDPVNSSDRFKSDLNRLRWQAWLDAGKAIADIDSTKPVFIAWWDDAQRIDLLSGQQTWVDAPVGEAFEHDYRNLWRHVSGGFEASAVPLKQLAVWLLSDAESALRSIRNQTGADNVYILVTIDDLARLSEVRALSGKPVPFETRLFPADENVHRQIARVRRWARAKGAGSYLVEHLAGRGVRVWRITTFEGERTLLARLLPFTSSLVKPLATLDLVHRSDWSGFLSIYRWNRSEVEKVAPNANTR